ncbi:hypothetical protein HY441_01640 [Candidatus Microgenomates bacterium]|nr:hypothetical protein [Candidatus Microgenomates bacterium]
MDDQTQKQQITEILRQATNVVITTRKQPSIDDVAAVIALAQIMEKMGRRCEAVISGEVPSNLNFLPLGLLHQQFKGVRDFVIELDTSKTEADKLKYVPDARSKRVKVFVTPYDGNFTKDDLSFSYGDYHCDGVIALGASGLSDLDPAIASQNELLSKTRVVTVSAAGQTPAAAANVLAWHEPQASSVCEMLMSLTEALQSGLLDNQIATSLLTGIDSATDHFTAPNTTPKIMTMAAQLMAAGADQAAIIRHLQEQPSAKATQPRGKKAAAKSGGELEPDKERQIPHGGSTKAKVVPPKPMAEVRPAQAPSPPVAPPPPASRAPRVSPPPPAPGTSPPRNFVPPPPLPPGPPRYGQTTSIPPLAKPPQYGLPDQPTPVQPPVSPSPALPPLPPQPITPPNIRPMPISDVRGPLGGASSVAPPAGVPTTVPPPPAAAGPTQAAPKIDVEAARRAVDEATRNAPTPQLPTDAPSPAPPLPPPPPPFDSAHPSSGPRGTLSPSNGQGKPPPPANPTS